MKKLVFAALLVVVLPGCAGVTDRFLERAESVSDRFLDGFDALEALLRQKAARLALAKCRAPYTALLRYGCKSDRHLAAVARDCGLVIRCGAGVALVPPAEGPRR